MPAPAGALGTRADDRGGSRVRLGPTRKNRDNAAMGCGTSARVCRRVGLAATVCVLAVVSVGARPASGSGDYRDDWALPRGFSLEVDAKGFELPTAIAFVRHPGSGPNDPLYFVAELRGTIKAVTNDRTVVRFANIGIRKPNERYPALAAQNGSAAICLDDAHGYVFVTYAALDKSGVLRNGIARLSSNPRTFGLQATGQVEVGQAFAPYATAANHQIGGCVVRGDAVFVGVGDGTVSARAQNPDQLSGKIVRMTLDGKPSPGNPFTDAPASAPRRYVWAYGLRNPFGLALVGDELFATQNGISIDSFLRIERGRNYGWNGTDDSIGTNAEAVMIPAVAPVHLAYYGGGDLFPARYAGTFFFGSAQSAADRGAGVMALRYEVGSDRVVVPPASFVRFRRSSGGEVAGVALGPDGLYFAALVPNPQLGTAPVYRVTYDPGAAYPHRLVANESGSMLVQRFGCSSCHELDNVGSSSGPSLDRPALAERIAARLGSAEYRATVEELDRLTTEPFVSHRADRAAVLAATGDAQVVLWIEKRLLEPRFDDPHAAMPRLGLTAGQARAVAEYLVHGEFEGAARPPIGLEERARDALTSKRFLGGVVVGLGAALALAALGWLGRRRRRSRSGSLTP